MLIGNKCDMNDRRQVTFEEGLELAQQYKIPFIEGSAKSGENIDLTFTILAKNM